jgi:L-ascorbate metabolism protein UlaG (beta-lactamase superfamily)
MHPFEDITVSEDAVGIHWFGQSSFGLKDTNGTIVQIDPYFPRERPAERYVHARPPLHEAALRTDFILLTHNHGDHTCIESINRIRAAYPEVRFIGPEESIQAVLEAGVEPSLTTIVSAGDSVKMGAMQAHTVWAKPPQGLPEDKIQPPDVTHLGYVVEVGQVRVYVSGDPVNTFGDHEELLQPVRQLKPDIGLLTTHPNEGEFPYFDGSAKIASALGLKAAVPAHYACFVRRNYDAQEWASHLQDVQPLLIPYNQSIAFTKN